MEIPQPPTFSDELYSECRESNDFRPILFEWYKYVGLMCNFYSSISFDSPFIKLINPLNYSILVGLLNRCSRLMLANIALSHKGYYSETVSIIDRCIFESSIKLMWLCKKDDDEIFKIYIADGLKSEIELKNKISKNIAGRNNQIQNIENRMLNSIQNILTESGLDENTINSIKKAPDLASMVEIVYNDRLLYIVGQKIGSHYIHGTFPNLIKFYLRKENDRYIPRDHDCEVKPDQYIFTSKFVLDAIISFIHYISKDHNDAEKLSVLPESISNEIMKIFNEIIDNDFEII